MTLLLQLPTPRELAVTWKTLPDTADFLQDLEVCRGCIFASGSGARPSEETLWFLCSMDAVESITGTAA